MPEPTKTPTTPQTQDSIPAVPPESSPFTFPFCAVLKRANRDGKPDGQDKYGTAEILPDKQSFEHTQAAAIQWAKNVLKGEPNAKVEVYAIRRQLIGTIHPEK